MASKSLVSNLVAFCVLTASTAAFAGPILLISSMDGAQAGSGSPGTGMAFVMLDPVSGDVTVDGTFDGLLGSTTVAHIHGPAGPGDSAPPIITLTLGAGTVTGAGTLSSTQIDDMLAGLHYINIHSSRDPGGEIRGQILIPAPGSAMVLLGAGLIATRRRRP